MNGANLNVPTPKPQRNNNPFALVQTFPDNWQGYTGGKPFLSFDNPANGVRAGFINLYNRYLSKGLNTIDLIAPVYTGIANWNDYAQGLSKISGLNIETKITLDNWAKLGRAIEQMENGYRWVSDSDFNEGLKMALTRIGK